LIVIKEGPKGRAAILFCTLLWMGGMVGGGSILNLAACPQAVATVPAKPEKPAETGVWHHFGEGTNQPQRLPPPDRQSYADHIRRLELQMYDMINRDRLDPRNDSETKGRAMPLRWNDKLAEVARAHSRDMLNQRFFDHVDRQGRSPAMRLKAVGMDWQSVGENIAIHSSIPGAQAAFMDEPRFKLNHRGNILSSKYTEVGIGIVEGPDGRYYVTQDFYSAASAPGK
jgi:uncharacterized protein YkwD